GGPGFSCACSAAGDEACESPNGQSSTSIGCTQYSRGDAGVACPGTDLRCAGCLESGRETAACLTFSPGFRYCQALQGRPGSAGMSVQRVAELLAELVGELAVVEALILRAGVFDLERAHQVADAANGHPVVA